MFSELLPGWPFFHSITSPLYFLHSCVTRQTLYSCTTKMVNNSYLLTTTSVPIPSTQNRVPKTQYPKSSTQNLVPKPSTQNLVPKIQYPIQGFICFNFIPVCLYLFNQTDSTPSDMPQGCYIGLHQPENPLYTEQILLICNIFFNLFYIIRPIVSQFRFMKNACVSSFAL